jgi:hypothetical protein
VGGAALLADISFAFFGHQTTPSPNLKIIEQLAPLKNGAQQSTNDFSVMLNLLSPTRNSKNL